MLKNNVARFAVGQALHIHGCGAYGGASLSDCAMRSAHGASVLCLCKT